MRKLLSCVIVALMIVSSVVPVFAYTDRSEIPAPAAENTISVWAGDIVYDTVVDEGKKVDIYVNIANNTVDGVEYLKVWCLYPDCLTLDSMGRTSQCISQSSEITPSSEHTKEEVLNGEQELFEKQFMELAGYDVGEPGNRTPEQQATFEARVNALLTDHGFDYKYTSPLFDFDRKDLVYDPDEDDDVEIQSELREEGKIIRIRFIYDATKNPNNKDLDIKLMTGPEDNLHANIPGYQYANEWVNVEMYGCTVDIKPDGAECTHENTTTSNANVVPATCTVDGSHDEVVTCTDCGEIISSTHVVDTAPGHDFVAGTVVPPSCTEAGYTVYECSRCDATENRDATDALGHLAGDAVLTVAPTDSSEGEITATCSRCGANMDAEVLPAIVSPTVAIADQTVYPNAAVTVPVALTNGNYGIDDVTFTLTWAKGLGEDVAITLGGLYTEDDSIALGAIVEGETTYSRKVTITTPVEDLTEREGDGALAVVAFTAPEVDSATEYTVAFATDDDWCAQIIRGNKFLGFIDYTAPAAASATITVDPNACTHNYVGEVTTPATCTTKGVMTYTCSICGASYTEEIDMIPHTPAEAVVENVVEAGCLDAGSHDDVVYCSVCGTEISRTPVVDEALGHDFVAGTVVPPDCTNPGYTVYTCSRCDATENRDATDALGHSYNEGVVTTPASCSAEGVKTYTCSRCGNTYDEPIVKLAHTPGEWEEKIPATPEHNGVDVIKCTVCGEELETKETFYKTLELAVVAGTDTVSATVDNTNRVINITSKLDAKRAVYQLKLAHEKTNVFNLSEAAYAAGNQVKISGVVYSNKDDAAAATGIRYFMAYATGGFNQSFKLEITTADGAFYEYTVNVTFDHSPACTGATPGHTTTSAGFDAEDPSIIRVVAKAGQTTANFKFKDIKKGTRFEFPNGNQPHLIQTADGGVTYTEFAEHDPTVICYLKSNKAEPETCNYRIDLVYPNGDKDSYTVIVTFPEP